MWLLILVFASRDSMFLNLKKDLIVNCIKDPIYANLCEVNAVL